MADLGALLQSINKTKQNIMRGTEVEPQVITGYPAFLIRRLLSYHQDAAMIVNELNQLPHLDNQMQYEFLLHMLPKRNRFSKTHKAPNVERLQLVKQYYKYSDAKAFETLDLHTEEDFVQMQAHLSEGGVDAAPASL